MLRRAIVLFLAYQLAGCTSYSWYHPSKNQADFNGDTKTCAQLAYQAAPVDNRTTVLAQGYTNPSQTNCNSSFNGINGTTTCTTTPAEVVPPVVNTYDANDNKRNNAFNYCMNLKGWTLHKNQ